MSVLKFVSQFIDKVMPMHCQVCDEPADTGHELCESCKASLPWLMEGCDVCAMPLPSGVSGVCGDCIHTPKEYDRLISIFRYEAQVREMIIRMKFANKLATARLLGELLAEALPYHLDKPDVLIPVPLHSSRIKKRGYNQSLELGRQIANEWDVVMEPQWVRRKVATETQSKLSGATRRTNMKDAFVSSDKVKGKRVLILDDVVTTGATIGEMAKVLRAAGAVSVEVIAVARVV